MSTTLAISKCSSGCKAGGHASYAQCLKSKSVGLTPTLLSSSQKNWNAELNAYESAVSQGIQPSGTKMKNITDAVEISQRTGKAFDATNPLGSIGG